jgi:hypothetical protein
MFSRTLDERYWKNALNVQKALLESTGKLPTMDVTTYELYDKAFSFPRIRRYDFVQ